MIPFNFYINANSIQNLKIGLILDFNFNFYFHLNFFFHLIIPLANFEITNFWNLSIKLTPLKFYFNACTSLFFKQLEIFLNLYLSNFKMLNEYNYIHHILTIFFFNQFLVVWTLNDTLNILGILFYNHKNNKTGMDRFQDCCKA